MIEELLPPGGAAPRCAPFTRTSGFDPVGTAIRADLVFLVDVERPWPKPIRDHPVLTGMMDVVGGLLPPARLFASVPQTATPMVTAFGRVGASMRVTAAPRAADLATQLETMAGDAAANWEPASPTLLVCAQGSHDICCGSDGERLAGAVSARWPDIRVHRISHTGGHRFAPTGLTLPDGRMWAHLDPDAVRGIVDRSISAPAAAPRCRGWIGADRGFAQAGERAVFAAVGWDLDDTARRVSVDQRAEDAAVVVVEAGPRSWEMEVTIARHVPTISCRAPGGKPAKPAPEFAVREFRERGPAP